MVKGVANVWVPVQDIERALDFYQNTLGFSLIKRDGPWAEVDAGGLDAREPEDLEGNDLQLYEPPRSQDPRTPRPVVRAGMMAGHETGGARRF